MSDGKVPMQASGQESKGAAQPDGVNTQQERGAAGESDFAGKQADYPHDRLPSEEGKFGGFFGHGGQSHVTDRSNSGKKIDEAEVD